MSYMELIERVKPRPEIWQQSHPLFKNKMVRTKFWHRLAKELNTEETQLRKNWKYLSDQYRREYKKVSAQEKASGEAVESGWAYYEALSFLRPGMTIKQRDQFERSAWVQGSSESDNNDTEEPAQEAYTSLQNYDNNESTTWQNQSFNKQGKKRNASVSKADLILRKLQNLKTTMVQSQSEVSKNDEDYMFLMSILPMIKNLSPIKKLQLRGKINDWLLEMMSEREDSDPLNSVSQYAMVEEEDNKDALRDQLMAAEVDD